MKNKCLNMLIAFISDFGYIVMYEKLKIDIWLSVKSVMISIFQELTFKNNFLEALIFY